MANFCGVCGGPVPVGSDSGFCTHHGGPPLKEDDQIRCPFCRELILAEAKKCKHCGEFLQPNPSAPPRVPAALAPIGQIGSPFNAKWAGLSDYYQDEFEAIQASGERYQGKWNWAAFLFGAFWGLTKGLWIPALIAFVGALFTSGLVAVAYWFIFAIRGNYMYYRKIVRNENAVV